MHINIVSNQHFTWSGHWNGLCMKLPLWEPAIYWGGMGAPWSTLIVNGLNGKKMGQSNELNDETCFQHMSWVLNLGTEVGSQVIHQ